MIEPRENNATPEAPQPPHDWARLIRKLRWIGLEDEAKRLELAVSTLPSEERDAGVFEPFDTD